MKRTVFSPRGTMTAGPLVYRVRRGVGGPYNKKWVLTVWRYRTKSRGAIVLAAHEHKDVLYALARSLDHWKLYEARL